MGATRGVLGMVGGLAAGGLLLVSATGTYAGWRDSETLDGGVLRSGELSLLNGNAAVQTADYAFSELAGSALGPGGWAQAPLTLRNAGGADLTYRLAAATATDPTGLAGSLRLRIKQVALATSCPTGVGAPEPSPGGDLWYDGPLLGASTESDRALPVAATEALCLRVQVADTVPPAQQATSTAVIFTFAAVST